MYVSEQTGSSENQLKRGACSTAFWIMTALPPILSAADSTLRKPSFIHCACHVCAKFYMELWDML